MMDRICIDDGCHLSEKATPCFREQMFYHICTIPTEKMVEIVRKYNLARFPDILKRKTLANLICDHTLENVAEQLLNGDHNE